MPRRLKKKSSKIEKQAGFMLPAAAAAVILSGLWAINNLNDSDQGLLGNIDNALARINNFLEDNGQGWTGTFFWGTLGKEARTHLGKLKKDLVDLRSAVSEFSKIRSDLYQPRTLEELNQLGADKAQLVSSQMEQFKAKLLNIRPEIISTIAQYSDTDYKLNNTNQSTIGKGVGMLGNWLGSNFFATDQFKKIKNALGTLAESIDSTVEFIVKVLPNYQKEIQDRLAAVPEFMAPKAAPAGKPTVPSSNQSATSTKPAQPAQPTQSPPQEQSNEDWELDFGET